MSYNRALEQTKAYLLKIENPTEEEQNLLKEVEEALQHFPVIRLHRDTIRQAGYIADNLDDGDLKSIATYVESNLDFWDTLKTVLENYDGVYQDGHKFCPKCGSPKTDFYDFDMTYMCDKCDHQWVDLDGMYFRVNSGHDKYIKEKIEPFLKQCIPNYSHIEEDKTTGIARFEAFQVGARAGCVTIFQSNVWTIKTTSRLKPEELNQIIENDTTE